MLKADSKDFFELHLRSYLRVRNFPLILNGNGNVYENEFLMSEISLTFGFQISRYFLLVLESSLKTRR